ncbi:MAG TPA: CDP-glycerol glycerophosphotransferase family protein [Ornithinimicrobium sp.]|uniref:CDP-glycerol glycerophosphotransferase family protein n=1 Tax=Ornithinimicrobium sp. TaxID=1977084 RepID=UPI002B480133|nr:CDP-glycerol glycerophosphotransferase family protein [Ornithinimicrobium sp.]HKJ10949.1 CDP-glycerol glycerophosphotransferase family protein [Ornithinimicrobium sp.]
MSVQPVCEYVDIAGSRLHVAIRLVGADLPAGSRFTLRLQRRTGTLVAQSSAEVTWRVNAVGTWSRCALRFELACDALPAGSFRLHLSAEPDAAPPALVRPSTGLLATSRPMTVGGRRMQLFPSAGRPALWLRVASAHPLSGIVWSLRNAVRDLAFAAHGRRFSWVRLARVLSAPFVPSGPIWLIGERPETARDNGRALFVHLRRTRPQASVYYLISADSPMRAAVEPFGQVVTHSSWRHRLLMLHADVLANAYSIKHMLPSRWHPGAYMWQATWRIGARRVYLKHGVHLSPYAVKRANGGYDLIATVGPRETAALGQTSGYSDQLVQTGLARYDALLVDAEPTRTVLFMPTWRRYLVPTLFGGADDAMVPFAGSAYATFLDELLGSPRLAAILEAHDLTLQMVPHYNLASVLRLPGRASHRIEVLDAATADIPALLRSCRLLLTDYSSVQFDVAYVGTPVVYCQFDEEEFTSGHGAFSWFTAERDGFGPATSGVQGALDAIDAYAESGFERETRYQARVDAVFAHRDQQNCDRLVAAIDALEG